MIDKVAEETAAKLAEVRAKLDARVVNLVTPTPDENKIKLVLNVLRRLEAGEQFTGMAILLCDGRGYEWPYDGKYFELINCGTRFVHTMNLKLDEAQSHD